MEADVLPRVISGYSIGALIAALICVHTDEELPNLFVPGGIDLAAFSKQPGGSIQRKMVRLFTQGTTKSVFYFVGYLLDVKVLEDCVQSNVQDITFEVLLIDNSFN